MNKYRSDQSSVSPIHRGNQHGDDGYRHPQDVAQDAAPKPTFVSFGATSKPMAQDHQYDRHSKQAQEEGKRISSHTRLLG